jgi:hypothetical protein
MPRPYSDKFLRMLNSPEEENLGIELGRTCVAANLPATYVAVALEASRMTVYKWFRGQDIRRHRRSTVRAFIGLVTADMELGRLPAKTLQDSKEYIENMVGVKISS